MSETAEDRVFLLHAPDGLEWAHFIATRLATPVYNIACKIDQFECYDDPSDTPSHATDAGEAIYSNCYDDEPVPQTSSAASSNSTESTSLAKPSLPEKRASKVNEEASSKNLFSDDINTSRASVILISPGIVESSHPLPIDVHSLKAGSTVFIFLGVELEDARAFFKADIESVLKCKCGFVHSTEQQTIADALVQIIEAYEDVGESEQCEECEELYNVLPNSRQLNVIEKVFPTQLTELERDVYILLSWPPEDALQLVLESEELAEKNIDLISMSDKLYTFTLPDGIVGDISFHLECQGQKFGRTRLRMPTKLDRLRDILESELDPLALLASAVHLPKDDLGDIDVTLAHKLQQLSPATKLQNLFPFEDEVRVSQADRPSSTKWPTLLHFAAEWNLRTLCSELLRYPGMVLAACTENADGEFPSQMASRKGFSDLEADLLQFMEKERESECSQPGPPLPPPRVVSNPGSAGGSPRLKPKPGPKPVIRPNSKQDEGQLYIDMASTGKIHRLNRLFPKPKALSESSSFRKTFAYFGKFSRERSGSDVLGASKVNTTITRRTTSRSFGQGDADYKQLHSALRLSTSQSDNLYVTMEENAAVNNDDQELFDYPDESHIPDEQSPKCVSSAEGSPTSLKALKRLGVCEADIRASIVERSNSPEPAMFLSASCPPGKYPMRTSSKFYVDDPRCSYSSNWAEDNPSYGQDFASDGKRTLKKEKIKSFFSKIKSSTKPNIGKKSATSKARRGSESSEKSLGQGHLILDLERDSGSYSDEENDTKTVKHRIHRSKVFKENGKPIGRRLSRRVESAKKERIVAFPDLPGSGDKTRMQLKF